MKLSKNYDKLGLTPSDHDEMRRVFESISGIEKVVLFGSRAKGNWKR